jgi:hypothetical protein
VAAIGCLGPKSPGWGKWTRLYSWTAPLRGLVYWTHLLLGTGDELLREGFDRAHMVVGGENSWDAAIALEFRIRLRHGR